MEPKVLSATIDRGVDPVELKRSIARKIPGALVQTVDVKAATNGAYVDMIAAQTLLADGTDCMLARKPEVDFLLRLAGTTQISRAIEEVGAKKGRPFLLVVAGSSEQLAEVDLQVHGGSELTRRPLSEKELDNVEKAALLNVEKA